MKVFWVLFAVFAGAAADLMCLNTHFVPRCLIPHSSPANSGRDFCSTMPAMKRCVEDLAVECEVASRPEVISVVAAFDDICQEGTRVGQEFQKHEECMKNLGQEHMMTCSMPIMGEVMRLSRPSSEDIAAQDIFKREIVEIACRHGDELHQCIIDAVVKECGSEAGDFYKVLNSVGNALNQLSCQENNSYLEGLRNEPKRISKRSAPRTSNRRKTYK